MGVINLSPESFYTACDVALDEDIIAVVTAAINEGATILDIGAQSTKPGEKMIDFNEEWRRIKIACATIRKSFPEVVLSIDTMRSEIARRAVMEYGANIINDISAGEMDKEMFSIVAKLGVPYMMTHMRGTPEEALKFTNYNHLMAEIIAYFEQKIDTLHQMGVKDVIIDPGFGFSKTVEQNYDLLQQMACLTVLNTPIAVGVSHKSMIYKPLNITPQQALNGTTALHMVALQNGANILRVHEVKPAMECILLHQLTSNN